jgi:CelD/BcsL family acetyltransferase involved in cellulose biosynthesis
MKFQYLQAHDLTPSYVEAWHAIQRANPALDSPFLCPEFTQAVAAVRKGVEVAVIEEEGEPTAFFPYQRSQWNAGKAVGGRMCDVQAVIAPSGFTWDAHQLIRACRLAAWDFSNLLACQQPFQSCHVRVEQAAYMDLSQGFDAYYAARRKAGSEKMKQAMKLGRKAEREIGPLRFEAHTADPKVFAALIGWKTAQYRRTNAANVFAHRWTVELLKRVAAQSSEAFSGVLSTLYIGDQLAAIELALRSYAVSHAWFAVYNPELGRYSPGTLLTLELAKAAPSMGIQRIDLGKITQMEYKSSFMSGSHQVARGSVAARPLARWLRRSWHRTREWIKSSPLRGPAELAGRWTRPLRGWLAFR